MTYIAGNKTAQDWKSFLEKEPKDELFWASAFADYFYKRLEPVRRHVFRYARV